MPEQKIENLHTSPPESKLRLIIKEYENFSVSLVAKDCTNPLYTTLYSIWFDTKTWDSLLYISRDVRLQYSFV